MVKYAHYSVVGDGDHKTYKFKTIAEALKHVVKFYKAVPYMSESIEATMYGVYWDSNGEMDSDVLAKFYPEEKNGRWAIEVESHVRSHKWDYGYLSPRGTIIQKHYKRK